MNIGNIDIKVEEGSSIIFLIILIVSNIESNKVVLQNISKLLNTIGVVDYNPEITSTLLDIFHCIVN